MAGRRVGDAEIERRIEQVVQWLSEGMPRRMIYDEVSRRYGVSNRQADDYLSRARKRLVEQFRETREEFVATQIAALEHLSHLATKGKQYSAAAGARATMARMVGVDNPKQNGGHNRKDKASD